MNIVFDFGGVLFDWRPRELVRRALPVHAPDEAAAARLADAIFEGYGGDWGEFDRGALAVPELVGRIAARTGLPKVALQALVDAVPAALQPVEATVRWLADLRDAGHALYFLSNMPAPFADHLEAEHDFVGWFRAGVFSARVGAIKPEPAIYALAAQRFGQPPQSLVFIDDVLDNVQAARAAGWQALQFRDAASASVALRGLSIIREGSAAG